MTNSINLNICASIQARMGSTRFPGKVMKEIFGKPMLLRQIERLKECKTLNKIIIATTERTEDDEIVEMCLNNSISFFRGSENNVIDRVANLLQEFQVDVHVECVGDSPLIDPLIVDEYVKLFCRRENNYDYLSNCLSTSYPPGLDVIVYNSKILTQLNNELSKDDPLREHVGYNITRFPEKYNIKSLTAPDAFNDPEFYLEVDTEEDFELIKKIYSHFHNKGQEKFYLADIMELLKEQPHLREINNKTPRKWKVLRGEED